MSPQRKKWLLGALGSIAILSIILGVTISQVADQPGPLEAQHNVVLPEGTGILKIGKLMKDEGVVDSSLLFPFYYILLEYHRPLKAGEYKFAAGASYRQVLETLGSGITVVRKLTIPEGFTAAQALVLLQENETLRGDIPGIVPEGSIMPDTYHYSYGDHRGWLLERMQKSMSEYLAKAWEKRAKDIPVTTINEALTLASIVEKETGVPSERGRVAAVYTNRLRIGMRLQADPTVIYGITLGKGALGRPITREDLTTPTPYNTYVNTGLPPAPIALPSRESIAAVLNPPTTKDIFFVADGKGGHHFSATLDQHNKNVSQYRKLQNAKDEPKKDAKKKPVKDEKKPEPKKPEEKKDVKKEEKKEEKKKEAKKPAPSKPADETAPLPAGVDQ